jgi:atypical dual specificity phosphatase
MLQLQQVNIGYGEKNLLRDINFDIADHGIHGLMGPSGVGKTSLLRAIGRWNDNLPDYWAEGRILHNGINLLGNEIDDLELHTRLPMLAQKSRLYTGSVIENIYPDGDADQHYDECRAHLQSLGLLSQFKDLLDHPVMLLSLAEHKKILLARLMVSLPDYLLLDEPLRDVAINAEADLEAFIRTLAEKTAIILVTHNKPEAKRLCDQITLVSGDRIIESTAADLFFSEPQTELGREFLLSGSCWPRDEDEDKTIPLSPPATKPRPGRKPREFHWIIHGSLAGAQKPGLLGDTEDELRRLAELGIRRLITLTEDPFEHDLENFNIQAHHFPIVDMSVPTLEYAELICEEVSAFMDRDIPCVLHCKAGLGRTGTLLACTLVYRGANPVQAIDQIRIINPAYIQTDEQLAFVGEFASCRDTTSVVRDRKEERL